MSELSEGREQKSTRHDAVLSVLKDSFGQSLGVDVSELDVHTSFFELGADSLFLLRASQVVQNKLGVKVPFRMMFEEVDTIDKLAEYIAQNLPTDDVPTATEAPAPVASEAPAEMPPEPAPAALSCTPETVQQQPLPTTPAEPAAQPEVGRTQASFAPPAPRALASAPAPARTSHAEGGRPLPATTLERILNQQLQVMSQQLELLRYKGVPVEVAPATVNVQGVASSHGSESGGGGSNGDSQQTRAALPAPAATVAAPPPVLPTADASEAKPTQTLQFTQRPVPYRPPSVTKDAAEKLRAQQLRHLGKLIETFNARTRESKRLAQAYRPMLANNRATAGFRAMWKELLYPLTTQRGEGAHLWDIDGNEYVDIAMGFGALLFGHSPDFILNAVQEQARLGIQLAGESPLVGQAAELLCELTGNERVTFCNSGTEAVMAVLRLARAATGRSKVAIFEGCYHGTFDGVMVTSGRTEDGKLRAVPAAPGIPPRMIEDVILLSINDPESLNILRANAHELAAVMIEPMPSRFPDLQPRPFLHALRKLTEETGVVLIFDEVVTGFRFHKGGAQALFDVRADLIAYGKALGGGLPCAALGGKAIYMDAIDGGMWSYGDSSYPRGETTFFAGTYFKHPFIMPAIWAALNHLKERGSELQEGLNRLTAQMVGEINSFFEQDDVPIRVVSFHSLFRFLPTRTLEFMELFYYYMLNKGIYISETRTCYLSTPHTQEDIRRVIEAVKETVAEMREAGFLPSPGAGTQQQHTGAPQPSRSQESGDGSSPPPASARNSERPAATALSEQSSNGDPASVRRVPLTEAQKGLWIVTQMDDEAARAYNESMILSLRGPFDASAMRNAIQTVVDRHESLRATFTPNEDSLRIAPELKIEIPLTDLSHLNGDERETQLNALLRNEAQQPFDFIRGPLLRVRIVKLEEQYHLLVFTIHHLTTDGVSNGILIREIGAFYAAACEGTTCELPPPMPFSDYAMLNANEQDSPEMEAAEKYWLDKFADTVPVLELPTDHPRPSIQTYTGERRHVAFEAALYQDIKKLSARQGCTVVITMLGAFEILLHLLTGKDEIVLGIHSAGQLSMNNQNLVGFCINMLPVRARITDTLTVREHLRAARREMLDVQQHQLYPFSRLVKKLNLVRDPSRPPLISTVFNLDHGSAQLKFGELEVCPVESPTAFARFDLLWNMVDLGNELALDCTYNRDLFEPASVQSWIEDFQTIVHRMIERPEMTVGEMAAAVAAERERRQAAQDEELKEMRLRKFKGIKRRVAHG
ncbi:MAG TPA: aminotransferase class III-fold pyridoxal phosphate-dependent enzyme [Pyrinomonadaceae bacterium]|nr:aminotransferase class III-fold pyridoxal phosphate-dependent enzyme [Pyrinomonadaceae bacterium]